MRMISYSGFGIFDLTCERKVAQSRQKISRLSVMTVEGLAGSMLLYC